jgi:hypothetical protein
VKGSVGALFYEAESALQSGTQGGADILAFLLVGNLGYSFVDFPLSSVQGGYDYLSGTPAGSERAESFDPIFPTAHRHWGIMDYFTNIPVQTFDRGLEDIYLRLTVRPAEDLSVSVTGHNFRLAEYYVGRRNLGQEVDLVGTYSYNKHLRFEIGGGGFFSDEIMKFEFGGEDPGLWGYVSVTAGF